MTIIDSNKYINKTPGPLNIYKIKEITLLYITQQRYITESNMNTAEEKKSK